MVCHDARLFTDEEAVGKVGEYRPSARVALAVDLAPERREPWLLGARLPGRPIVVLDLAEPGGGHVGAPRLDGVECAVAPGAEPFVVSSVRVRAEEDAARPERCPKVAENASELLRRDMKERRVGEDSVKAAGGQREVEKALVEDFAARAARHLYEGRGAVEPYGLVTEGAEVGEVTPRAAAEVEDRERRRTFDRAQKSRIILRHVVVAGAVAERLRRRFVVGHGAGGDAVELRGGERMVAEVLSQGSPRLPRTNDLLRGRRRGRRCRRRGRWRGRRRIRADDLLRPLRDMVRRRRVLERQEERGVAAVLPGQDLRGVDREHPELLLLLRRPGPCGSRKGHIAQLTTAFHRTIQWFLRPLLKW